MRSAHDDDCTVGVRIVSARTTGTLELGRARRVWGAPLSQVGRRRRHQRRRWSPARRCSPAGATTRTAGTHGAPASPSTKVNVGAIVSQSGPLAADFSPYLSGVKAYFDYVNAAGRCQRTPARPRLPARRRVQPDHGHHRRRDARERGQGLRDRRRLDALLQRPQVPLHHLNARSSATRRATSGAVRRTSSPTTARSSTSTPRSRSSPTWRSRRSRPTPR